MGQDGWKQGVANDFVALVLEERKRLWKALCSRWGGVHGCIAMFLLEVGSNGTDVSHLHIPPDAALAKKCVCICRCISKGSIANSI
jgi:hypothetical protein